MLLQIPEMIISSISNSAQEIETEALNMLKHPKVKITCERSNVMKVMERCEATWIKDLYQQHIPISLALIQEALLIGMSEFKSQAMLGAEI
jgi:hypothetical protein